MSTCWVACGFSNLGVLPSWGGSNAVPEENKEAEEMLSNTPPKCRKVGCFLLPGIPCTKELLRLIRLAKNTNCKISQIKKNYKYKKIFGTILKNLVLPGCLFFLLCLPAFYLVGSCFPSPGFPIFWDSLLSKKSQTLSFYPLP